MRRLMKRVMQRPKSADRRNITQKQIDVYDYIRHCIHSGTPPTVREISAYMGLSKTGARCHIQALARKGYITLTPNKQRNIRLNGDNREA
jgi:repressor LexA